MSATCVVIAYLVGTLGMLFAAFAQAALGHRRIAA